MATSLSPEQVRLVLRRAAEIERRPERDVAAVGENEVAEIAAEVGIAPSAVRHALAELRAGLVDVPAEEVTFLDRLVGPAAVTHSRTVAGTVPEVRAAIERFMGRQIMQMKRNLGDRGQIWEPAPDFWSGVKRVFSIGQRVAFEKGTEVTVQVVPAPGMEDHVFVRMSARLVEPQRRRAWQAGFGAVAGAGIAAAGIAAFATVGPEIASVVAGAGTAAGTLAATRSGQRRDLAQTEAAILRFLDALEHNEPEPARPVPFQWPKWTF